ncbi:hypothetical protein FRC0061_00535 [Corynebacterium diphtheriae]|nr:hypothetical protein FRC0061_00535 [Corynebacterium diphtheriae]
MRRLLSPRFTVPLTLAVAISTASTTQVWIPIPYAIASEPTADAMVEGYYYKVAPDGEKYKNTISTFAHISKTRHMYHDASRKQHYDNFHDRTRKEQLMEIHHRSERACFIGKARVVLALMQAEGNTTARSLDISKVGIELDESSKALPLLKESLNTHRTLYSKNPTAEEAKLIDKRAILSREGKSALEDIIKALENGEDPQEYNAFSVLNWGVEKSYLDKVHGTHHAHSGSSHMPELKISAVSTSDKDTKDKVLADADHNRQALATSLPMPAPTVSVPLDNQASSTKEPGAKGVESEKTGFFQSEIWNHIVTFFKYFGIAAGLFSIFAFLANR